MTWEVDLRHDLHAAHVRILHYGAYLILRVILPAALVEPREALGLDAPALIVAEVPVQHVQLLQRRALDDAHDLRRWEKVPRAVKRQGAMGIFRRVGYIAAVYLPAVDELIERRERPDNAALRRRRDLRARLRDREAVRLLRHSLTSERDARRAAVRQPRAREKRLCAPWREVRIVKPHPVRHTQCAAARGNVRRARDKLQELHVPCLLIC